jgi:hypothetical protein
MIHQLIWVERKLQGHCWYKIHLCCVLSTVCVTTIYYSAEFDPLLALLSPEIAPKNTYVEETRITWPLCTQLGASFFIYGVGYMFNAFILILFVYWTITDMKKINAFISLTSNSKCYCCPGITKVNTMALVLSWYKLNSFELFSLIHLVYIQRKAVQARVKSLTRLHSHVHEKKLPLTGSMIWSDILEQPAGIAVTWSSWCRSAMLLLLDAIREPGTAVQRPTARCGGEARNSWWLAYTPCGDEEFKPSEKHYFSVYDSRTTIEL